MGRQPQNNPKEQEAKQMYKDGMLLKDIALKIGVPDSSVRRWKCVHDWDGTKDKSTLKNKKKQSERSQKNNERSQNEAERTGENKKRGARLGNKNAVGNRGGNGPPIGTAQNLKYGAFETLMLELFTDDEKAIFLADVDEETINDIKKELKLLNVKEYRLNKRINYLQAMCQTPEDLLYGKTHEIRENVKGTFKTNEETGEVVKDKGSGFFDGEREEVIIKAGISIFDALKSLEGELDKTQGRKQRLLKDIEAIKLAREKIELDRKRLSGESETNKIANAWVAAMTSTTSTPISSTEVKLIGGGVTYESE